MMSKNTFAMFGFLALIVLSLGFASATISTTPASLSTSIDQGNSATLDLTVVNDFTSVDFTINSVTFTSLTVGSNTIASSNLNSNITLGSVVSQGGGTLLSSVTINVPSSQTTGTYTGSVNISGNTTTYREVIVPITVTVTAPTTFEFCEFGRVGTDQLEITSVNDEELDNDKEWEWRPLDDIEVEVKVKNLGDTDEDYTVELIFVDDNFNTVDVAEDDDDLEEDVSIDEGERETVIFKFSVDGDIDSDTYDMHVKAYREGDEDIICTSQSPDDNKDVESVRIKKSSHDVVVKSVEGNDNFEAGSTVTLEVDIANIGSNDEDKVRVIMVNSELGLKETKELDDLDEGDRETVTFVFDLPEFAEEKGYKLTFSTEFDYDEDDEVYDDESDSDDDFDYFVTVFGGEAKEPSIGATLTSSKPMVGEKVSVSSTITNNGQSSEEFLVSVTGFEDWAELESSELQTMTISSKDSKTIVIEFVPTEGGSQTFTINVVSNGKTTTRDVIVNVAKEEGFFDDMSDTVKYLLMGIVVLIILIILILIIRVALRVGRA